MPRVKVAEVCQRSRAFREDGEKLRRVILQQWSNTEPVSIDFENIRIASVSFLDESIGVLALDHPLSVIRARLNVVNMRDEDRQLLSGILLSRAAERADETQTPARRAPLESREDVTERQRKAKALAQKATWALDALKAAMQYATLAETDRPLPQMEAAAVLEELARWGVTNAEDCAVCARQLRARPPGTWGAPELSSIADCLMSAIWDISHD